MLRAKDFVNCSAGEPTSDDLISFDVERHSSSYYKALMPLLRECGIPENWIYAMYRTDGLMPSKMNESRLTQYDLDAFEAYMREYDQLEREVEQFGGKHGKEESLISVLALVMVGNEIIREQATDIVNHLTSGLNYFLNYQNKDGGILRHHLARLMNTSRLWPYGQLKR